MTRRQPGYLMLATFGLLLYYGLRIFQLDALPLFIDETIIIEWTEDVRSGSPIGFGYHGKYLLPWTSALFEPIQRGYWVVRAVTLLFVMIGAASLIALGRRIYGRGASLLALIVATFTPMLFFFDRLALTDTVLHAMLTLWTLTLFISFDRHTPRLKFALLAGIIFIVALLAKSTAFVMLPLPLVAAALLPRRWPIAQRLKLIALIYGTSALLWAPLHLLLSLRGMNYFGLANQFSAPINALPPFTIMRDNLTFLLDGLWAYFGLGLPLMLAAFALALVLRPRRSLVLLALVGGMVLAITIVGSGGVSLRYWLGMLPIALLLAVGGFALLIERWPVRVQASAYALCGVGMILWGLPFVLTAYTDPIALPLPAPDRLSYIESDAAGIGIPELADWLQANSAGRPLVGAFPQCVTLGLYLDALTADLHCEDVIADNDRVGRVQASLDEQTVPYLFIVEQPGYVQRDDFPQVDLTQAYASARPGAYMTLNVYAAMP